MIAAAGGNYVDAAHLVEHLSRIDSEGGLQNPVLADPRLQGAMHGFRLLVDFLVHEAVVPALVLELALPFNTHHFARDGAFNPGQKRVHAHSGQADFGDVLLF